MSCRELVFGRVEREYIYEFFLDLQTVRFSIYSYETLNSVAVT